MPVGMRLPVTARRMQLSQFCTDLVAIPPPTPYFASTDGAGESGIPRKYLFIARLNSIFALNFCHQDIFRQV